LQRLGGADAYVVDKAAIDRAIDTMHPVDPISYKPALTAAYNVLQHTNARIKHIIVLGDGDAEDSYYPLVTQIHKAAARTRVHSNNVG
jgi:hypothetical protein